jgi:hypothetical protein
MGRERAQHCGPDTAKRREKKKKEKASESTEKGRLEPSWFKLLLEFW